ncbi:NtaA/DmoA family FMN-dependent monooxygenase [Mycolicibacterium grossiae]|uniref:Xenobiotic monooxygenase n=1 Tax=Mycolicibacterium grossiae TaxID=1552759 RepID=A0A1E8Q905_9MYCO|nr:NtaA/DmoA family FMN-dependent monooxygenase [Mycolicibacterium grossiae]OFJ54459.1 xenobiotic monooxygenase [Mycolicibacterium grossiae]QEM45879.1 NtaA/DmoA family FMN-dependent monooxygenase [Mycolicibacterium grossiae]
MSDDRRMHLGLTIWPTGFHPAAWRLPGSHPDGNSNPTLLREAAQTAERGVFDFFFIGDRLVGLTGSQFANPNEVLRPEALTLASHIAAVTTNIGLITTVNTTYSDPYNVARATATIDHLSAGRVGLNIVTGKNEEAARNFGRDQHWDNDRRYDWAAEYIQVLELLWDSWEDDARVADAATGRFVDSDRVHQIGFRGEFFSVDGPLNVQRPVQGRLPIVNAGASERSRELGARFSDLRFTNSSTLGLAGAREYYADLKSRLSAHGRSPEDQLIIPGVAVYVEDTDADARQRYSELQHLLRTGPAGRARLSEAFGVDLSALPDDARIGDVVDTTALPHAGRTALDTSIDLYGHDDPTLAEITATLLRGAMFKEVVGSPQRVADVLEEWFTTGAADGFMIFPPRVPYNIDRFVDLVVPELQRRGLHRREYTGRTLRDHLGLSRPVNRFSAAPEAVPS